jgi:uncharacterized protein (DUF302 family)
MNNTIKNKPEMIDFVGIRVRHFTTVSFDQVLAELRARVGGTFTKSKELLNIDTETREEFERRVEKHLGPSGFMLFSEIDHGVWIKKFGIKRRMLRWIIGNPLIAITMIQHDYTAGLFVPIDLLLAEDDDGVGCNVTYAVPSSLIMFEKNPELRSAAEILDAKFESLVSEAMATNE